MDDFAIKTPVSVFVVTYNSSVTILDTLDSILNQSYQELELIISDDCSKDNTLSICKDWLSKHKNRFIHAEIIESLSNTGVSANVNRARQKCNYIWAKGVAGDDILLPNCIQILMEYVSKHSESVAIFSKMIGFGKSEEEVEEYMQAKFNYSFFRLATPDQYHYLLFKGNCVPAPTFFFNLAFLNSNGFWADERIPLIDDYPLWIKLTHMGVKLDFIDEVLVKYRLSEASISTASHHSTLVKKSNSLVYILILFKPRFNSSNSLPEKLGEIRKLIHSAYDAYGGPLWRTLMGIDYFLATILRHFGIKIK